MKMHWNSRKKWASIVLASTTIVAMAGCSSGGGGGGASSGTNAPPKPLSINVGYIATSINGNSIIAVANQKKLWAKAGLDVNVVPFTDGPTSIAAMQSGQIDIGYIGSGAVWLPATGKATVIAPNEISTGDVVLARPDAGIKNLQDLKGKTIGFPQGGTGEMIMDLALEKAGLGATDVKEIAMAPASVVTAFIGKQIDAAGIFSPLSAQILQTAPDTITLAKNTDFPDVAFMGAWVANTNSVKTKAEAVKRFLEVYVQANDYRIAHTKQTVAWAAALSGTPNPQLTQQASVSKWTKSSQIEKNNANGTTFAQFKSLETIFVKMGRMDKVNDPKTFVNTELFSKAYKALQ